jgi:hypothetical protein
MNTDASITPRPDAWTRADHARIFVCAMPETMASREWRVTWDMLRKRLPGTELVTKGWLSSCTGMVIAPLAANTGTVGDQADIAVALGIPVLVLTRHGLATTGELIADPYVYYARRSATPAAVSALVQMGALPLRR